MRQCREATEMIVRRRQLWIFATGLSLPILPALLAQPTAQSERGRRLSATELATCVRHGGRVGIAGLSGNQICVHPLRDAGRACTSSSQCVGDCLLDESSLGGRPPDANQSVQGRCEPTDYGFGCRTTVENGSIATSICVD
jgi:hypothetical protein